MRDMPAICVVNDSINSLVDGNDRMERPDDVHTAYFYHRSSSNYSSKTASEKRPQFINTLVLDPKATYTKIL